MIMDILTNSKRYLPLHKGFAKAFAFLMRPDLETLPVGRYEIDGDHVYAMVAQDRGRDMKDALLETHERYIDIQFVLGGTDRMGWKPKVACAQPAGGYDNQADIQFFADQPDVWLPTSSGMFAIFFPEDAHMPLISSGQIHKVVVKIAVDHES